MNFCPKQTNKPQVTEQLSGLKQIYYLTHSSYGSAGSSFAGRSWLCLSWSYSKAVLLISAVLLRLWRGGAGCWQEASSSLYPDFSTGLLESPHDMVGGLLPSEKLSQRAQSSRCFLTSSGNPQTIISTIPCRFYRSSLFTMDRGGVLGRGKGRRYQGGRNHWKPSWSWPPQFPMHSLI